MRIQKELINELESYFLCQHRAYVEAIGRAIDRDKRDDLKSVQGNWYKYCVDGKLSAKRYRVKKAKELNVTTASNMAGEKSSNQEQGTEPLNGTASRLHQEEMVREAANEQPGMFSNGIAWITTKIKNNRGLLGMVAGIGLTYAGQAAANQYRERQNKAKYGMTEKEFVNQTMAANPPSGDKPGM